MRDHQARAPQSAGRVPDQARYGIVVGRFHADISARLLQAAEQTLQAAGALPGAVAIVQVPGAFEIPVVARRLALSGQVDGVLCLGCVIRGATDHYDHICRTVADGIMRVALESGRPVIFGVLTAATREQALERSGGRVGNVGASGAAALIEMVRLMWSLSE